MKTSTFKNHLLAGLLLLSCLSEAQETTPATTGPLYGGFGYYAVSAEQIQVNDLNRSLAANGYGQFPAQVASMGGGGGFMIRNFFIGGGGAWLMGADRSVNGNRSSLRGGYGLFHLGYALHAGKHQVLYPCLGIGGGGFDLGFTRYNFSSDFNEQVGAPIGTTTIRAGGLMLSAQVAWQYFFCRDAMQGFCVGVKAGYKYAPSAWNFSVNETALSNAPDVNMNGVFLTLFIGGGSLTR